MGRLSDDSGRDFATDELLKTDLSTKLADNNTNAITGSHVRSVLNSIIKTIQSWRVSEGTNSMRPRFHSDAKAYGTRGIATGTSLSYGSDCFAGGDKSLADSPNNGSSFAYGNRAYATGTNSVCFGDHQTGYIQLQLTYISPTSTAGVYYYTAFVTNDYSLNRIKYLFLDSSNGNFAKAMLLSAKDGARDVVNYYIFNKSTLVDSTSSQTTLNKYLVKGYEYDPENSRYLMKIECGDTAILTGYYYINAGAAGSQSSTFGTGNCVLGFNSLSSGSSNITIGKWCNVTGLNNLVFGKKNNVSGDTNLVNADETTVTGWRNIITQKVNSATSALNENNYVKTSIIAGNNNFVYSDYTSTSPFPSYVCSGLNVSGNENVVCATNGSAEGCNNILYGVEGHVEGAGSICAGTASHAQGKQTYALGYISNSAGYNSMAYNDYSSASGYGSNESFTFQYDSEEQAFYLTNNSFDIVKYAGLGPINLPVYSSSSIFTKSSIYYYDKFLSNSFVTLVSSIVYDSTKNKYRINFDSLTLIPTDSTVTYYYISNIASGYYAVVNGYKCSAMASNSYAYGYDTIVLGNNSVGFGYGGKITQSNSFGYLYSGDLLNANNSAIFASGGNNTINSSCYKCTVLSGENNTLTSCIGTTVLGYGNNVTGLNQSLVVGNSMTVTNALGNGLYTDNLHVKDSADLYSYVSSREQGLKESFVKEVIKSVDVSGSIQNQVLYTVPAGYHAEPLEFKVTFRPNDTTKSCVLTMTAQVYALNNTISEDTSDNMYLDSSHGWTDSFLETKTYGRNGSNGDIKINVVTGTGSSTSQYATVYLKLLVAPLE